MNEIVLGVDHLALFILAAITLLSFMVAINAQGVTRLSISFLIATVILVLSVFATVSVMNKKSTEELISTREKAQAEKEALAKQLEDQKQMISAKNERLKLEREKSMNQEKIKIAAQLTALTNIASHLKSVQLHDYTLDYSQLTARAYAMVNKVKRAKADFASLGTELEHFQSVVPTINDGIAKLENSAKYYRLYYSANDERQERVREGIIRSSAQEAEKAFQTVNKIVNSTK